MKKETKSIDLSHFVTKIIFTLGIILRVIACLLARADKFQHDVLRNGGHFDYAKYIYNNWHLADTNYYEFAQPPVNAIFQAMMMKFVSLFKSSHTGPSLLYQYSKILTLIYSIITLYIIYKIISEFDLPQKAKNVFFAIMALYPGLIVMTTQYSNDCISYMFFYLSLYLGI